MCGRVLPPVRTLLGLAAGASWVAAFWLFSVTVTVLPARDPGHIPLWRVVALALVADGGLTWLCLLRSPRPPAIRLLRVGLSAAAVALGLWAILAMSARGASGGHFEGYVVLLGVLLAGHGVAALAYLLLLAGRDQVRPDQTPD
jgi:hypothetical protein